MPHVGLPGLAGAIVAAGMLAAYVAHAVSGGRTVRDLVLAAVTGAAVAAGLLGQVLGGYHVAVLLLGAAAVLAARSGARARARFALAGLASAAVLAAQLADLHAHGVPFRQSMGALLGWPSIWPQIAIAQYSIAAAVAGGLMLVASAWLLARRQAVPDFVLFLVLGAWVPLLMIGWMRWDIPPRYAAAQIFPLLLAAFAAGQWAWGRVTAGTRGAASAAAAGVACALAVNPIAFAREVGAGYADHPDNDGAAAFVKAQHPGPRDIVLAEDVIVQTYYLGHVDYWLIGEPTGSQFTHVVDGRPVDMYTNSPLISTAAQLERLIARPDRGAIYIIGSGEQQEDGRTFARGPSIERFLTSPSLPVVYVGRDGLTKVWKIPAPSAHAKSATGPRN